jgi:hypothetical protein
MLAIPIRVDGSYISLRRTLHEERAEPKKDERRSVVCVLVEIRIAQTMSIHTVPKHFVITFLVQRRGHAVNFSDKDEPSE